MGNPQHYALELPERCLHLIENLWTSASGVHGGETPDLGPLTSTFLLSMSMPIINIPIERTERHIGKAAGETYADDRFLGARAEAAFTTVIRKGRLGEAPFYQDGAWRFVILDKPPFPNIADGLPGETTDALCSEKASANARDMPASQWISTLRNGLAHGGIAYLDEHGRSSWDSPVKMYVFVSGRYDKPKCQHADAECRFGFGTLKGLNVLRISEEDYFYFLRAWVGWLVENRMSRVSVA